MKVKIYSRGDDNSNNQVHEITEILAQNGFEIDPVTPDIVISVGGDGTLLRAVRDNINLIDSVHFLGVHTGTLGFFTEFSVEEIKDIPKLLKNTLVNKVGEYTEKEYNLLEFEVCTSEYCRSGYALNEITLINPYYTQVLEVEVDNQPFFTSRGTGICVSTAIGSTAYAKSLVGAIIDGRLPIMQIVEMASINNNVYRSLGAPIVLSKGREVLLKSPSLEKVTFTYDTEHEQLDGYEYIKCRVSDKNVKFISKKNTGFVHKVKKSFL